tara:strand:- start:137 stop:286 length:150 start_codon:yes stop_codon:yes gene_type:complete
MRPASITQTRNQQLRPLLGEARTAKPSLDEPLLAITFEKRGSITNETIG